jgi:hypothetical protein
MPNRAECSHTGSAPSLKSGASAVCDGLGLLLLRPYPPSALSRAPHRTGAMAHGLADILAYQAGSGARRRRTETAQTTGVAECGKCDVCAQPGRQQPIPAKVDARNELLAIRSNPHGYRDRAASDGQQPILTRSRVGPFMPWAPATSSRPRAERVAGARLRRARGSRRGSRERRRERRSSCRRGGSTSRRR